MGSNDELLIVFIVSRNVEVKFFVDVSVIVVELFVGILNGSKNFRVILLVFDFVVSKNKINKVWSYRLL